LSITVLSRDSAEFSNIAGFSLEIISLVQADRMVQALFCSHVILLALAASPESSE